jgi:hypothetical protein
VTARNRREGGEKTKGGWQDTLLRDSLGLSNLVQQMRKLPCLDCRAGTWCTGGYTHSDTSIRNEQWARPCPLPQLQDLPTLVPQHLASNVFCRK